MEVHGDERVDLGDGVACALRLRPADVVLAVDDLALQIGLLDSIELDDAQGADTGRSQIQQRRGTQSAGADHQHPGILEPQLRLGAEVRDDQVPAVAGDLIAGQLSSRGDQRRQ